MTWIITPVAMMITNWCRINPAMSMLIALTRIIAAVTMEKVRRTFTEEFKQQIVQLYQNGKPRKDIIREYELTPSSLDKWINQSKSSGSFKEKDTLAPNRKNCRNLGNVISN
ncbi:transposase [Bacillus salipaludis]|uniref:Transposase n=1 Tax=Bacillus salipaludis TaxID=2547811 RepID=A0ABW8RDV6_9BACI